MSQELKKAVCCLRYDNHGPTRVEQLRDIQLYAQHNQIDVVKTFEDLNNDGVSSFDEAIAFAVRNKVDQLIVWRLDRIGERGRHIDKVMEVVATLADEQIAFVCLKNDLYSTQSAQTFSKRLIDAVTDARSLIKSERVSCALRTAKMYGEPVGRPTERNDELIKEFKSQGYCQREIAERTGVSIWAVQRALRIKTLN